MANPKMEPVESKAFTHHGHDPEANELHLTYRNGDTWAYPITAAQHDDYQKAGSKGGWVGANIDKKAGRKVASGGR